MAVNNIKKSIKIIYNILYRIVYMGCFSSKIHMTQREILKDNEIYMLRQELEEKNKELQQLEHELYNTNMNTKTTIINLRKQVSNMKITQ